MSTRLDPSRSLMGKLVIIALMQMVAITASAMVVAYFTHPAFDKDGETHEHHDLPSSSRCPKKARAAASRDPRMPQAPPEQVREEFVTHRHTIRLPTGPLLTLIVTLLLLLVSAALIARWLVSPLRELERTSERLGHGEFGARCELAREDELGQLGHTLNEMAARIESMLLAERTLLANLSHELRTPLARVRVAMEIMEEEEEFDNSSEQLRDISTDLSEVEALLDDILASARLESARTAPAAELLASTKVTASATTLLSQALQRFQSRHPQREVLIDVRTDLTIPVHVHVMLMRRALENLLENAHKYTPDPTLPLTMRLEPTPDGAHVTFTIIDRGEGIPEEEQSLLFTPFFRGDLARKRGDHTGLGLGLTLVHRIITAHGGTIEVESEAGVGTAFRITLPILDERSAP